MKQVTDNPIKTQQTWRKCKIIATIGPASADVETIYSMIMAGMNIARVNLSHGSIEWHREIVHNIHEAAGKAGRVVGVLADIPGPKLRINNMDKPLQVKNGDLLIISGEADASNIISVYPVSCIPEVYPGDNILIGDGTIELTVVSSGPAITASVIHGGLIREGMGVVIPDRRPVVPFVGEEFVKHLSIALQLSPDYIALSFIGSAQDIRDTRALLNRNNAGDIPVIAKIESRDAVSRLMEIIRESDGIMVARGDLGAYLPIEQVPHIQRTIIRCCNKTGIPVITATEMLESMVHNTRPTRAEVTDVAHAILDGTDATMLSAETSLGESPVNSVLMMSRIATETELHLPYLSILKDREDWYERSVEAVISNHACFIAEELASPAIVAYTRSGLTAERVSRYRPRSPIIAITSESRIAKRLLLFWGVIPVIADPVTSQTELQTTAVRIALETGIADPGDQLVIIAGNFAGKEGRTNLIKVKEVT